MGAGADGDEEKIQQADFTRAINRQTMTPSALAFRVLSLASFLTLACGGSAASRPPTPEPGGSGGDSTEEGGAGGTTKHPDSGTSNAGGTGETAGTGGTSGSGGTSGTGGMRPEADAAGGSGGDEVGGSNGGAPDAAPTGKDGPVMTGPPPSDDQPLPACKNTVMAANSGELATKLGGAQPGDCILLADGDYTFPTISKTATAAAPIVVRAQNRGKVNTGSIVFSGASHVVLEGMVLTGANIKVQNSDYCRISRFRFKVQDAAENDWIQMSGSTNHTRIDHNDLGPKNLLGNIVMFSGGANAQVVQYNRVDHNFFHDVKGGGGNGWESLRVGLSGLAASKGFNIIEYNLFKNATGDPETISVKSCDNTVRYNTFRASNGEITLRHGNRTMVYGNFILADGLASARGIRVCGSHHHIFNNYIEGVTAAAAIALEGGDADGGPGDIPGAAHFRVYDAQVVHNTIVNGRGISVGASHPDAPSGCVVANNLVQNPSGDAITDTSSVMTTYAGNISSAGAGPGTKMGDPKLVKSDGAFRITAGSAAIDSAVGSYPYVTDDMDGQPRTKADVGADELAAGPVTRHPLVEADVGPDAP
jgi:hypothetical protein